MLSQIFDNSNTCAVCSDWYLRALRAFYPGESTGNLRLPARWASVFLATATNVSYGIIHVYMCLCIFLFCYLWLYIVENKLTTTVASTTATAIANGLWLIMMLRNTLLKARMKIIANSQKTYSDIFHIAYWSTFDRSLSLMVRMIVGQHLSMEQNSNY